MPHKNKSKKWTKEEIIYLEKNYLKKEYKEIAKKLSRSRSSIINKLRKMGLIKIHPNLTNEETEKIKNYWKKGLSVSKIKEIMKISKRVIYNRTEKIRKAQRKEDLENFKNKLKKMNKFEIGYFLGMLDGEGCLTIGEHTNTPTTPRFFPTLDITNSDEEMINYIRNLVPFNYRTRIRKNNPKWKDVFVCRIYDRKKLKVLLKFLMPYKWVKKTQARIILKFLNTKDEIKRKEYCNQIRKLNKRGK